MKNIVLITLEYPPAKGGVAKYLHNIYSRLPKEGVQILVPRLSSRIWPRWFPIFWQTLGSYFLKKFSEIHISHVLPVGYVALIWKKLFRVPYIVYVHGLDVLLPQKSAWKKFWLKKILQKARQIIANSNFTKTEISKLGIPEDKIKVVYPCITNQLAPYSRELENRLREQHKLDGKKIILSVGRLIERKGFDKVISAMPKILKEIPEAVYVIVGNGPCRDGLLQIASRLEMRSNLDALRSSDALVGAKEEGLTLTYPKILFISNASDDELHAWYEIADVLAMPARQIDVDVEGFGIVFLEAALHGKPSVGGRSGGIPEAVEDDKTGILVDPNNVDEIAGALIRLLKDDKLTRKLGQAAQERVLNQFICRNMGEALK